MKIPRQLSALTLYRCEQSVLDYCHAHLSLHLNMGMDPTTQELGGPRPAGISGSLMKHKAVWEGTGTGKEAKETINLLQRILDPG
eukprot:superscaffoldBa00000494_g5173